MGTWNCTECSESLTSLVALRQHILDKHNMYANRPKPNEPIEYKDLTVQTLEKLREVKKQVKWLYENREWTKGDDEILILEHLKYFQNMLIYTPESQRISFKDPSGVTYEQFKYMTSPETITRAGRKIREQDRKLYHDKEGTIIKEHKCMLGTPKSELRRQRRQQIYRDNIKYM